MANENASRPVEGRKREAGEASKGQYGGLKGLGPGGGSDIEDASDTSGIDRDDVKATK